MSCFFRVPRTSMTCRHRGVQAYRHTGIQAYRHTGIQACRHGGAQAKGHLGIHPVSITRFSITRFSPGSGLLRNPFVS